MTVLDTFIKRIFTIHEGSTKHILGLQGINSISILNRALTRIYAVGIDAVNALTKNIAMLGQRMYGLIITRLVSDLLPLLRPFLEAWSKGLGDAVVSRLEPLEASISFRLIPPRRVIAGVIGRLAEESRKLSILPYEGITTIPSVPLVLHSPTPEVIGAVGDHVSRISEVRRRFYETAPAMTIRAGIDYGGVGERASRGVFEVIERGMREAYSAEALEVTSTRLDAVDTFGEVSEKLVAPTSILAPPIAHAQRYVVDVSEAGRVIQPLTKEVSGAYESRVLKPISKVYEVSRFAGEAPVPLKTGIEIAKTGRLVLTIPEIDRGLQLITEGATKAYMVGLPGITSPITEAVAERVSEAPIMETVRITQPLAKKVSEAYRVRVIEPVSKIHEVSWFVGRVPIPTEQAIEIAKSSRLVLTIPEMERGLQLITEGKAKAYSMELPIIAPQPTEVVEERVAEIPVRVGVEYAPQIKGISMLGYDLARRVADMRTIKPPHIETGLVDRLLEMRSNDLDRVNQKISEVYRAGAPVMWLPPVIEATEVASDHIGRISNMVLEGAVAYRLGVSAGPSFIEAMRAVPSVPSISDFTGRVPSLRTPVVEMEVVSKHVSMVPEAERVSRLIAEKVAEAYRLGILDLIPPPVEAVADRVVKASGVGFVEAQRLYPGAEVMEAIKAAQIVPSISKFTGRVPSLRIPKVEREVMSKQVLVVPEVERIYRLIAEEMAEAYKLGILSLTQPPFAAVADSVAKTSGLSIIEAEQLYPTPEVVEIISALSGVFSGVHGPLLGIVKEKMEESVRELSAAAPSVLHPPSSVEVAKMVGGYVGEMSEISRALDLSRIASKEVDAYRVDMEEAIKGSIGVVVGSLSRTPVGNYILERVPLEAPKTIPTVKLHEIIPLLSSVRSPDRTERPTAVQRDRTVDRLRPIEVKVDAVRGEIDMRELRRKIARILREEARRHGVY